MTTPRPTQSRPQASGTNFPPPAGRPVATPVATPGAAPDADDTVGRRFAVPTATLLRLSRTVAALACLVAGAVGAWVLNTTSDSLSTIDQGTQQIIRLQEIKGDVLRADGLATIALAQGKAASATSDYTAALKDASKLTVEASQAQSLDQGDLTVVNAALLNYALAMERARTAYPKDNAAGLTYVTEAGTVLSVDTIPALDKLIAANEARVDTARAGDRLWAAGLALVPVLLLVGISLLLARRTKRVINIGLVVALAASVVLWRLVDSNLVDAADAVDSARSGSLQTVTAAATGYSSLAEARSIEGRELLQPTSLGTLEPTWSAAMAEVNAALKKLGIEGSAIATNVDAYTTAHTALADLLKANKLTDARTASANTTTGVTPAYEKASAALSGVVDSSKTATIKDMSSQRTNLLYASVIAVLLGLLAAAATLFGIGGRLREYR